MYNFTRMFWKQHWLAVVCAAAVGVIYITPHLAFIVSLGPEYKGIPMMQSQNEDYYLARIHEITEGHYSTGSFIFYEYKDAPPLTPPTIEFLYALPTLLLGIPLVATAIASRFFLPALLFLLAYFLISRLTGDRESLSHKVNAVAGALFVTLGYDLIDYRSAWEFLAQGKNLATAFTSGSFLIWSRLVHPIFGALLLFSFFLCLLSVVQRTGRRTAAMVGAAVSLALMFSSYFFSWGLAVSVAAALLVIFFLKKEYLVVRNLVLVLGGGMVLAFPYWITVWRATLSPWYQESLLRGGLFYTHYPIWNKLMLAVLALFVILVLPHLRKAATRKMEDWQCFSLALIFGSLWVYIQQVVTGRTIWPYHFPQYTIPFALVVVFVLLYNIIKSRFPSFWGATVVCSALICVMYGVALQSGVYRASFNRFAQMQVYAPIFDTLNKQKSCVVLAKNDERRNWNYFIPAFTSCDIYTESGVSLLVPFDRIYHNYLVNLRLKGLTAETIENYLKDNPNAPREYLFGNWKGLYNLRDFPDLGDPLYEARRSTLVADYKEFIKKDFREELKKYRLDYILSLDPLSPVLLQALPGTKPLQGAGDLYLYQF